MANNIKGEFHPGGLVRPSGTVYTNVKNGQMYTQTQVPFGSSWVSMDTNITDDINVTEINTESIMSDTSITVSINGVAYKLVALKV